MKLSPFQLAVLAITGFGSVVLLNVLAQYQSNQGFKEYLSDIKPGDLLRIRSTRIAEEMMEPAGIAEEYTEDVLEVEDE